MRAPRIPIKRVLVGAVVGASILYGIASILILLFALVFFAWLSTYHE